MADILVDSNAMLDVVTQDPKWYDWSAGQLEKLAESHTLAINPIVYSEVPIGFERIEDPDKALPSNFFRRDPLPWEADFWQENVSSNTVARAASDTHHCRIFISERMPRYRASRC